MLAGVRRKLRSLGRGSSWIIAPNEDAEELGDKVMRADKKPEDFDSTNEYIEYLRNEIKSSREEIEDLDKNIPKQIKKIKPIKPKIENISKPTIADIYKKETQRYRDDKR